MSEMEVTDVGPESLLLQEVPVAMPQWEMTSSGLLKPFNPRTNRV